MAEVTPRHRRIMILADYGEESLNLKNVRDWIETGVGGSPPWDRTAQALADIEAEALASKPMLYEAHGHHVLGPPGDGKDLHCLLCDLIHTIGDHDATCVTEHAWRRQ